MKYYLFIALCALSFAAGAADKKENELKLDFERKMSAAINMPKFSLQQAEALLKDAPLESGDEVLFDEFFAVVESGEPKKVENFLAAHENFDVFTYREYRRGPRYEKRYPSYQPPIQFIQIKEDAVQVAQQQADWMKWMNNSEKENKYLNIVHMLQEAQFKYLQYAKKCAQAADSHAILHTLQENGTKDPDKIQGLPTGLKNLVEQYLGQQPA